MTVAEFSRVTFVGGGTMGCYNALLAALSGYEAVIYDLDSQVLEVVPLVQEAIGSHLIDIGYCSPGDLAMARNRTVVEADLTQAVRGAGLVSESVPERLALKREVFAQLESLCSPDTVLTSNTSALLISDIDSALIHGAHFAALHSHLGALLFDIVAGPRCSPSTVDLLVRYVSSLRGEPLVLNKEFPGYVFNALLGSVLTAAKWEVICGQAGIEDIDKAWMVYFAAPHGPFGLMDLFGLDVVADSWREPRQDPVRMARQPQVIALLQSYLDAGRLGRKTEAGFYDYPEAAYMSPDFTLSPDFEVIAPLLEALRDTAQLIEREGVASGADIDRAWCTALGVDKGPFSLSANLGNERTTR